MTFWTVIRRGITHYCRTHTGVVLGAALASMVLTGSLLVGDSVKATLCIEAMNRVGKAGSAMLANDRFFRATADPGASPDLASASGGAPVLLLRGSVTRADAAARVNQAQVLGVDARFWKLAPQSLDVTPAGFVLNERAAQQLGVKAGDRVVVRIEKPSAFSRDAPLSGEENQVVPIAGNVERIVDDGQYGRFAMQAGQVPPFSIFVPLPMLGQRLGIAAKANLLLVEDPESSHLEVIAGRGWRLEDAGLQLRKLDTGGAELRTDRVFLDPEIGAAAARQPGKRVDALTYFVNELRSGDHAAPYSIASAVDPAPSGFLPPDLKDDEAVINQWLADDLSVIAGAKLKIRYFVMTERRQLVEKEREFTIRAVLPMTDPEVNSSWMPDFPGLADKNNCRDWQPGFAFDSTRIRDKDQKYWEQYRGTPKAFVTLRAGQEMWSNRWGNLTSMRWPDAVSLEELSATLRSNLTLSKLGFQFLALRAQALAATDAPVDFGEYFVSFSFFLLAAAAILTGLLFVFSLQQRNHEAGLLLALGLRTGLVRRLFLVEGAILAVVGALLGLAGAAVYTQAVLYLLTNVWSGVGGGARFVFSASGTSLLTGAVCAIAVAIAAMWLASRRQFQVSARELLAGSGKESVDASHRQRRSRFSRPWSAVVAVLSLAGALSLVLFDRSRSSETFFSSGALLLIAGLAAALTWLRRSAGSHVSLDSLSQLGRRNAARRPGRSLATAAVLASGVFIVVAVDAFRETPSASDRRDSGSGGFALVATSALPIYEDLNSSKARDAYALSDAAMKGVSFVQLRVRDGDDASCLNLNRALQPRLLGVNPADLAARGAFRFASAIDPASASGAKRAGDWGILDAPSFDDAIPGVSDETTLEYGLQKKLGGTIEYRDDHGQPCRVRIVAALEGSILQGSVLISEKRFVENFPAQPGYRMYLIDAPAGSSKEVANELSRALSDRGFEVTPAARRLAEFQSVENTYLAIFQALGGLGLLLGSAGLSIVVARNILERRSEFALLEALGFRSNQVRRVLYAEHCWLIACGLAIGAGSAMLAVWPHLRQRAGGFPFAGMAVLLAALAAGSLFWVWFATRVGLRGSRVGALREE